MGYGSYNASDWTKLKESRGINESSGVDQLFRGSSTQTTGGTFLGRTFQDKYNPRFINMRESCDSEDSPQSTPIILAFDVTGSMGYLAAEIAKNSLNKTVLQIYDKHPVTDPHIMCAAITSPFSNGALQVTQFEADIRMVEQLLELQVGFGGNKYSYDSLIWYFAAKHTKIDCFDKRGKKGFLFVIGDEICGAQQGETLSAMEIRQVFDDETHASCELRELAVMASEKYEIFHIVTGNERQPRLAHSVDTWEQFLPGRVAYIPGSSIKYLSEVILSILQISGGMDRNSVIGQWDGEAREIVSKAVEKIRPNAPIPEVQTPVPPAEQPEPVKQSVEEPKKKGFFARLFAKITSGK